MKYIIHEIEDDAREELAQYGIEFDDADLITTYASVNDEDGSIREVKDLHLTIFDAANRTVAVFPVEDVIYDGLDTTLMLDIYKDFIGEYDGYKHVVGKFQTLTQEVMDPEVFIVSISAALLEDLSHSFQTKAGSQQVRVRSYIIQKNPKPTHPHTAAIRFDTHAIHSLCNNAIDFAYLLRSLKPSSAINVLVTIFDKDDKVVAIRTTKMRSGARAEIKGAYACSKGFGTLIQAWTEELIRTRGDALFPFPLPDHKPVTFRLSAIPSAVGFWKHVGFHATGEIDKEGQEILEKALYPNQPQPKRTRVSSTSSNKSTKTTSASKRPHKILITHA